MTERTLMEMPLSRVAKGIKVKIIRVEGGAFFHSKLTSLGLLPGREISVLNEVPGGPIVLEVMDSKIVLGRGMAGRIFVA
jgi:ferrous iron transport protein A